jgi:hypothetical protein
MLNLKKISRTVLAPILYHRETDDKSGLHIRHSFLICKERNMAIFFALQKNVYNSVSCFIPWTSMEHPFKDMEFAPYSCQYVLQSRMLKCRERI